MPILVRGQLEELETPHSYRSEFLWEPPFLWMFQSPEIGALTTTHKPYWLWAPNLNQANSCFCHNSLTAL